MFGQGFFPGYWSMGFGRDKVSGSYKVVRMFFEPSLCEILDVDIGEWRKLSPPPYEVHVGRRSVCVNGSIYWFEIPLQGGGVKILALDLHTEEFHDVAMPVDLIWKMDTRIVNLEDRLAIVTARVNDDLDWKLEIWTMDVEEERWSKTHFISLAHLSIREWETRWFTPVKISLQGDLLFYDNKKTLLYKYSPHTNLVSQIFPTCCDIISPHLENLVRFRTDQRIQSAYIPVSTCHFKDGIASGRGILSIRPSVDKLLPYGKGLGVLLTCNEMKMLAAFLVAYLLSSFFFSTVDLVDSLPMLLFVCYLSKFECWHIIKFFYKMIGFRLVIEIVMATPLVLIVAVLSSAVTAILIFMALGALARRLLLLLALPFQYLIRNASTIFYS